MFYQLPPVGNPVCLSARHDSDLPSFLSIKQSHLYDSGTAALAAAICAAKDVKGNEKAEVIMPAYACPDLVSAAEYAGVKPVLVDLEAERPWMDLQLLADAVTENTVAVVAVNLFGIRERWEQLRKLADEYAIVLIEDSAQHFPCDDKQDFQSDLVIFSFGRGKPVSLLGGGAVFCNATELYGSLPVPKLEISSFFQRVSFSLKVRLYNVLISPFIYWLPQSLPFLHLGETRYHKLDGIKSMDSMRSDLLLSNVYLYQKDTNARQCCSMISSMLDSLDLASDLPRVCGMPQDNRLLRYPVLLEAQSRDRVYQSLKKAGLGPSIMYPASLPKFAGLSHLLTGNQHFPNAEMFASRLLTLPTHSHVSKKNIDKMSVTLKTNISN